MTRINCVPPSELCGKHLVAEYRELPRVFTLVRDAIARQERPAHTDRYTLGKGHVRFFYTRLTWLARRQADLIAEMQRRGYRTSFGAPTLDGFPQEWCGDWEPTADALRINRERIAARMPRGGK
jgi:deoxyribonuclease (pyrimidine dimer)